MAGHDECAHCERVDRALSGCWDAGSGMMPGMDANADARFPPTADSSGRSNYPYCRPESLDQQFGVHGQLPKRRKPLRAKLLACIPRQPQPRRRRPPDHRPTNRPTQTRQEQDRAALPRQLPHRATRCPQRHPDQGLMTTPVSRALLRDARISFRGHIDLGHYATTPYFTTNP